jgi:polyhydroxybutyrate depolymerase
MKKKIICIFIVTLLIFTIPTLGKTIEKESYLINGLQENQENINEIISMNSENLVLQHQTITIRHRLLKRSYLLYVPTGYNGTNPVPLVVVFHGGGNTPENNSERFGVSEKAEEEGFIVVYPDASRFMSDTWNIGLGWYTKNIIRDIMRWWIDEVGYTLKIIAKTQKDYNIDTDRIYVAGHSNGASMAYNFGVLNCDIIAAIASNGGCIGGHVQDFDLVMIPEPDNPVSIAIFHGELDQVIPYNGGWNYNNKFFCTSVAEAVTFWVESNGCDLNPVSETIGNVTIDRYSGGDAGTEIIVYTVHNKGHIWFGGLSWEDPTPEISTTDEMWEFFETHPKQ